jgi:hypothetical protein
MTVHQLRINAVILLICALEAIEFGQLAAAERLSVRAAQYDAEADMIEASERQDAATLAKGLRQCLNFDLDVSQ